MSKRDWRKMLKRDILWWMILFLLFSNTLVTISINIAIVSMVNSRGVEGTKNQTSIAVCPNVSSFAEDFFSKDNHRSASIPENNGYDWSEAEQNSVLSGYYWLSYLSILPGGVLSHKYGAKLIVGYAQLISSTMSSVIPLVAGYGSKAVAWVRAIQGILSFVSVPAGIYSVMGNWIPSDERGKFGSAFMLGTLIGTTCGSFVFGYVARYLHWSYVFHGTSICGVIWGVLWYKFVYDSPSRHPTITTQELEHIEENLKNASIKDKRSIPWASIVTSIPFFVCVLGWCSSVWMLVMLITYVPSYLHTFYGLNADEIGVIISLTYLVGSVVVLSTGYCTDLIIRKGLISMNNMRKICTFIGNIGCVTPLVVMVCMRCNLSVAVVCTALAPILRSFAMFGAGLVVIDLSPRFSGILEGISGTAYCLVTFAFSAGINHLSAMMDIETMWSTVFLATAVFSVLCAVLFAVFGSAEVQGWNFNDAEIKERLEEMAPIERD